MPATNLLPRWRIITLPGWAGCPAYNLTPKYFGRESRPRAVEPADLVFAMPILSKFWSETLLNEQNFATKLSAPP